VSKFTPNKGMEYEDLLMRNQQYAAEIERLHIALGNALQERNHLQTECNKVKRMYCRVVAYHDITYRTPEDLANDKNWDCFKEDTNV